MNQSHQNNYIYFGAGVQMSERWQQLVPRMRTIQTLILITFFFHSGCREKRQNVVISNNKIEDRILRNDSLANAYVRNYFIQFIDEKKIGVEQNTGKGTDKEYFTTYLGKLKIDHKEHFVLSQFYAIQDSTLKRGNSRLIILDNNFDVARIYEVSRPEDLPIELYYNNLVFKIDDQDLYLSIDDQLPGSDCIPPGETCQQYIMYID